MPCKRLTFSAPGFGEAFNGLFDARDDASIESGHVLQSRLGPLDFHYSNPSRRIASA